MLNLTLLISSTFLWLWKDTSKSDSIINHGNKASIQRGLNMVDIIAPIKVSAKSWKLNKTISKSEFYPIESMDNSMLSISINVGLVTSYIHSPFVFTSYSFHTLLGWFIILLFQILINNKILNIFAVLWALIIIIIIIMRAFWGSRCRAIGPWNTGFLLYKYSVEMIIYCDLQKILWRDSRWI